MKSVGNKFAHQNWLEAEKRIPDLELRVVCALQNHSSSLLRKALIGSSSEKKKVLGDTFYVNNLRDKIYKLGYVEEYHGKLDKRVAPKKHKKKIGMTGGEIKLKNASDKIDKLASESIRLLSTPNGYKLLLKSDIVEMVGVAFLHILHVCALGKHNIQDVLEILVSSQRFSARCKDYTGINMINPVETHPISGVFIDDLTMAFEKLRTMYPFDGMTLYEQSPRLLIHAKYDKYIPFHDVQLRKSQIDIMDALHNNFENGVLISFNAMIGSGKTITSVAIAQYIENMRKFSPKYRQMELIFCCNLVSVKNQVARLCYNASIKFAVAYVHKPDGIPSVRVVNHFSCKKSEDRIVVICSPDAAQMLLAEADKYVLFLDEPTLGADTANSDVLRRNMEVMLNAPARTILSSATMPPLENLGPLVARYLSKYPTGTVKTVRSREIQIGCDVSTFAGMRVLPHVGCKTGAELAQILNTVETIPFLDRLYTYAAAVTLWKKIEELKIDTSDMPNIPMAFKDVDKLSSDLVRTLVIDILRKICGDDNIVAQVCEASSAEAFELRENRIGTIDAHKIPNMTLFADVDPIKYAKTNYADLLKDVKSIVRSASHIAEKYKKNMKTYLEGLEKINKIEDELTRTQLLNSEPKPKMEFPAFGHVNTREHHLKYNNAVGICRLPLTLEALDPNNEMGVEDDLMLLLYCGVGVYSTAISNTAYTDTVLSLASSGELAVLVADNSISYGANYPFGRVIIPADFARSCSVYTLFQLMGRAGRVGQSWKAEVIVSDELALTLLDFVRNPNKYNIETTNMLDMIEQIRAAS